MASNLKTSAANAVREWVSKQGKHAKSVRHVYPRCYVVGRAAPMCLVITRPWQDSEPQCKDFDKKHPLCVVHTFDESLDAGMWCAAAYVVRDGCSETVAVRFEA
jgi:hypothetical protein